MISRETIERVRREASIARVIGERVKLVRRGNSDVGLCPFHKEKTPSFHVHDERGYYYCFGCKASGDVIKFVQEVDGLAFAEAVRMLAELQGIPIEETGDPEERRREQQARKRKDELLEVSEEAARYFEQMLATHPLAELARAELERRGIDPAEPAARDALAAFRVGYAPYGWDGLANHLKQKRMSHGAAESVGLLVPRRNGPGHYDRFRHRLMFAVMDERGRVIAFSGRALDEPSDDQLARAGSDSSGTGEAPKYLNSPESPIYRKREALFGLHQSRTSIRNEALAVVVEGNFDTFSLHARGITNVVAMLGTALTKEQATRLKRLAPEAVLLFDGDEAGRSAVRKAREPCREAGLIVRVAALPDGADPDDVIRSKGTEGIQGLIRGGRSLLEYLIDTALDERFAADDARARAAKVREVAQLISEEDDPTVRAMAKRYVDKIARGVGVLDRETVLELERVIGRRRTAEPERTKNRAPEGRTAIERAIFGTLLDFPELLDDPVLSRRAEAIQGDLALGIAALRQLGDQLNQKDPEVVLAKLPSTIHPFAAERLAAPLHGRVAEARSELEANVNKLSKLELLAQKAEVMEEAKRVAATGDFDRELELLGEQMRRARERHGL